jgi:hypothetical protein
VIVVVAVFCCASLPLVGSSVRAEDKPVARAKWEYRVLNTTELVELAKDSVAFKKAMEKGDPLSLAVLGQFALNKLGDDGWELSAFVAIQHEGVWILKRPK